MLKGKYSQTETRIFLALRERESATSTSLLRKVYPRKDDQPFNAGIIVNRALSTLGEKLKKNREDFRLERRRVPKQRLIENRLTTMERKSRHESASRKS